MGGHAFRDLHCPRISPDLYLDIRHQTGNALRKLFIHVAVPTEMPAKTDYGDVDFLVSGFLLSSPSAALDWQSMVAQTKDAFGTAHGKRGYLNPNVMYFAIPKPNEEHVWVQIDVKVCDAHDKEMFEWEQFQLNYASGLKMLGSLVKPLGLTISPTGLHIRVEEIEATNFPDSLVFVTRQPTDVLKILGLDKRFLYKGFATVEEIYRYFACTWVFNPAHYAARLREGKYRDHLEDRSGPWVYFVTTWIPQHFPGYCLPHQDIPLKKWRKQMRLAIREKVFTLFPSITPKYFVKRGTFFKESEEYRLQQLLMDAIPAGQNGWREDIPQPPIVIKGDVFPITLPPESITLDQVSSGCKSHRHSDTLGTPNNSTFEPPLTPPRTPPSSVKSFQLGDPINGDPNQEALSTPLYLSPLTRSPPSAFVASPPPLNMSPSAKLLCLARWTHFDPVTGCPYLARQPREKRFEMCWSDSGASDEVLVNWMKELWWGVWARQARVNYVGMWRRRSEKEDANAEKVRAEKERARVEMQKAEKAHMELEARKIKILERLSALNGC